MGKKRPKKGIALKFLEYVRKKKFDAKTPVVLIKRIAEWEYNTIRDRIEDFYIKHTQLLTVKDIKERIKDLSVDDEKVLRDLEDNDVKSEDAFLVLVVSIFGIDFLVTFNRKHLINKKKVINEVLKENRLKKIEIVEPNEI